MTLPACPTDLHAETWLAPNIPLIPRFLVAMLLPSMCFDLLLSMCLLKHVQKHVDLTVRRIPPLS
jgi:hypothetical protein